MKTLTFILFMFVVVPFSMAGSKVHPLAENKSTAIHPWAESKKKQPAECITYVSCQVEAVGPLDFRSGEMWLKPAYCATCSGTTYKTNVKSFLEKGYKIKDSDLDGETIRLILEYETR